MKHGKKPTRRQREKIREMGLNPDNWLVERDSQHELVLIHRISGKVRRILYCYERSDRKIANQ